MKDDLEAIAKTHCRIPTLEARNMDAFDFHEVAVWELKAALKAAYQAGQRAEMDEVPVMPDDASGIISRVAVQVGGEVYEDYSGRGMYGAKCLGIVCADPVPCIEYAAENGIRGAVYDQMGLDYIVYWPEIRA